MKILAISGSRNPNGRTAAAVNAALEGASKAGASTEHVLLPPLRVERCRQCDENGWGLCRKEGLCIIEDDFPAIAEKIRDADALIFSTPVYYSDLSESLRAFLDRLRRTSSHEKGKAPLAGKPAIGICMAGGSGGGAPNCCANLEKILATCGFDVADMIPVKRQNLDLKKAQLTLLGEWLVGTSRK